MVGGCIFMEKIKPEDILYCSVDKLAFDFESSDFDLFAKTPDFPFKKEVILIGKEEVVFEMYSTSVWLDNYDKKIGFKIAYREKKYEVVDIFYNLKKKWRTGYVHWKLWRMAWLQDFDFGHDDVLTFVNEHFKWVKLKEIHVCTDVLLTNGKESETFIREIDKHVTANVPKAADRGFGIDLKDDRIEATFGKKGRGNKDFYYKIYDKKLEIENHQISDFYLDYVTRPEDVIRFEIEIRKNVAPKFSLSDIASSNGGKWAVVSKKLFGLLASYFTDKKHIDVFSEVSFENVKIKRQDNLLRGSLGKRVNDTGQIQNVKNIGTRLGRLDDKTQSSFSSTIRQIELTRRQAENYEYFLSLYRRTFETIQIAYEETRPQDFEELLNLIKAASSYAINFSGESQEEFFATITGWINRNEESVIQFLDGNEWYLTELMYFYYEGKYKEPIFTDLMDVIEAANLPVMAKYFAEKWNLRKRIEKKIENAGFTISGKKWEQERDEKTQLLEAMNCIFTPSENGK